MASMHRIIQRGNIRRRLTSEATKAGQLRLSFFLRSVRTPSAPPAANNNQAKGMGTGSPGSGGGQGGAPQGCASTNIGSKQKMIISKDGTA